jgi:hypothetical protein
VRELADELAADADQPVTGRVSPDGLAALAEPDAAADVRDEADAGSEGGRP